MTEELLDQEQLDFQESQLESTETPQETPTDPPEIPATPSRQDDELATLRQVTQNMMQRQEADAKELAELRKKVSAPVKEPETPLPDRNDDPIGYLEAVNNRRISELEKRLEDQTRPLQESLLAQQHMQNYAVEARKLIAKYPSLDAQFFTDLYPETGGASFNVEHLEIAMLTKLGSLAVSGKTPAKKVETPITDSMTIPRTPSSTTPPVQNSNPSKLTEGQRDAMRTMKLKPENAADVKKFMEYMGSDSRTYGDL